MTDAGMRGTSMGQDSRFKDKEALSIKATKFPKNFTDKVDLRKVNLSVLRGWIAQKVTELIKVEDDVVVEYVFGMLEDRDKPIPDPRRMQVSLVGFMNKHGAAAFMEALWTLLLSAQSTVGGVPAEFIAAKKAELEQRQMNERNQQDASRPAPRDGRPQASDSFDRRDDRLPSRPGGPGRDDDRRGPPRDDFRRGGPPRRFDDGRPPSFGERNRERDSGYGNRGRPGGNYGNRGDRDGDRNGNGQDGYRGGGGSGGGYRQPGDRFRDRDDDRAPPRRGYERSRSRSPPRYRRRSPSLHRRSPSPSTRRRSPSPLGRDRSITPPLRAKPSDGGGRRGGARAASRSRSTSPAPPSPPPPEAASPRPAARRGRPRSRTPTASSPSGRSRTRSRSRSRTRSPSGARARDRSPTITPPRRGRQDSTPPARGARPQVGRRRSDTPSVSPERRPRGYGERPREKRRRSPSYSRSPPARQSRRRQSSTPRRARRRSTSGDEGNGQAKEVREDQVVKKGRGRFTVEEETSGTGRAEPVVASSAGKKKLEGRLGQSKWA